MRKLIVLVLVAAGVILVASAALAACGSGTSSSSTPAGSPAAGTGATPEVARLAKSAGVPFVAALVTLPFAFEGLVRPEQAQKGLRALRKEVDFMMVFPN